jgi:hypothetical protein
MKCMNAQVECAINRATKEKRVAELEEALRASSVAFGVRFNKVSVRAQRPASAPCCAVHDTLRRMPGSAYARAACPVQLLTMHGAAAGTHAPDACMRASCSMRREPSCAGGDVRSLFPSP